MHNDDNYPNCTGGENRPARGHSQLQPTPMISASGVSMPTTFTAVKLNEVLTRVTTRQFELSEDHGATIPPTSERSIGSRHNSVGATLEGIGEWAPDIAGATMQPSRPAEQLGLELLWFGRFDPESSQPGPNYLAGSVIDAGPLAGHTLGGLGIAAEMSSLSPFEMPPYDLLWKWLARESARCRELYELCLRGARTRAQREACEYAFKHCKDSRVAWLAALAARAHVDPAIWYVTEALRRLHLGCLAKAEEIQDPTQRQEAIERCYKDLDLRLEHLYFFGLQLTASHAWGAALAKFAPTKRHDCPCCVGDESSIAFGISGPLECAQSIRDYSDSEHWNGDNFKDANGNIPLDFFKKRGQVGQRGGFGAFTAEISCTWQDSTKCRCECEWTQLVRTPGPKVPGHPDWQDDRSGMQDTFSKAGEENRKHWWKLCKGNRLCIGDLVQQGLYPYELSKTFHFRTIFFSSGTNCARNYCYIDWKVEFYRDAIGGDVLARATELGRGSG